MAEAAPEPKAKGSKSLVLILVGVLALAGGGGGAYLLFHKGGGTAEGSGGGAHAEASGKPQAEPGVISLESFITNLGGTDSDRYVKCTIRLELNPREAAEKVKLDELAITRIRDRILTLLSSKSFEEVASTDGKNRLRDEIKTQVEPLMEGGKVAEVYYSEFIVQ